MNKDIRNIINSINSNDGRQKRNEKVFFSFNRLRRKVWDKRYAEKGSAKLKEFEELKHELVK